MSKPKGYWQIKENCVKEAKKYKTVSEFHKGSPGAYKSARKNKWLKDFEAFFINPSVIWTYDTCLTEAKKYEYVGDFKANCGSAYNVARENKWLKGYTWLKLKTKPKNYWTRENCLLEAKTYETYHDFRGSVAYQVAQENGWLDEYSSIFFDYPKEQPTYEMCYNEASKYETLKDYRENGVTYNTATHKGYLKDFNWLKMATLPNNYWNYEKCYEEASKYKSRWDFGQNNSSAYYSAIRNGWIDEYVWFTYYKSCLEIEIAKFLEDRNIEYEEQKTFDWLVSKKNLHADFYIKSLGVIIECQGEQHFVPKEHFGGEEEYENIIKRDSVKKQLCEEHGIKVFYYSNLGIEYPYQVYEDKEELLKAIMSA